MSKLETDPSINMYIYIYIYVYIYIYMHIYICIEDGITFWLSTVRFFSQFETHPVYSCAVPGPRATSGMWCARAAQNMPLD